MQSKTNSIKKNNYLFNFLEINYYFIFKEENYDFIIFRQCKKNEHEFAITNCK